MTTTAEPATDLTAYCDELADRALAASRSLAMSSGQQRNDALRAMAKAIRASKAELQEANAKDLEAGKANGLSSAVQWLQEFRFTKADLSYLAELPLGYMPMLKSTVKRAW